MPDKITLAGYLFKRLQQVGLHAVHGVSGPYNTGLEREACRVGLEWSQHHSALNAALAAEGYARVKRIGAVILSYGFDDLFSESVLSAVSLAIDASYRDRIPLVLVFGTPERKAQIQAARYRKSFLEARPDIVHQHDIFEVLADMFNKITITQEFFVNPKDAMAQIDTAIRGCMIQSRPVYIELPVDLVDSLLPLRALSQPLEFNVPPNDPDLEQVVTTMIINRIARAKRPIILVDAGLLSCCLPKEVNYIARKTGFPTAATQFSRGLIDETLPNFHGEISDFDEYGSYLISTDLILSIGPLNTIEWADPAMFEAKKAQTVTFNWESVSIGHKRYGLFSKSVFKHILKALNDRQLFGLEPYPDLTNPRDSLQQLPSQKKSGHLRQDVYYTFWRRMSLFFCPGDIILTAGNVAQDGARCFVLPRNTTLIHSGPSRPPENILATASGVALAQKSISETANTPMHGRTIIFQGTRGFQTAQPFLNTILTQKNNLIIFVINNKRDAIVESLMHAMEINHCDSGCWHYSESVSFFGAPKDSPYPVCIMTARTWGELDIILGDNRIQTGTGLHVVELMFEPKDPSLRVHCEKYGGPSTLFSPKETHHSQD